MSNLITQINKRSAVSQAKASATKRGPVKAAATQSADALEEKWDQVQVGDVGVYADAKGQFVPFRRTRGADGKYMNSKSDPHKPLKIILPTFLLGHSSKLSGSGNVGDGKEFIAHYGNCVYKALLKKGNLSDGKERPGLVEKQVAGLAKVGEISRSIMGGVFDRAVQTQSKLWKLITDKALGQARSNMFNKYKDENGAVLSNPRELEALEEERDDVKKAVLAAAREIFIDGARSLPGIAHKDSEGREREAMLFATQKCWPFADFKEGTDARSDEKGPEYKDLPTLMRTFPAVYDVMTDLGGKMRRKLNMLGYSSAQTKEAMERPSRTYSFTKLSTITGEPEKVDRTMPDVFWNPTAVCFLDQREDQSTPPKDEDLKKIELESLVGMCVRWHVYRGDKTSTDKYGCKLIIAAPITIGGQTKRKAIYIPVDEEYTTGLYNPNDDEELFEGEDVVVADEVGDAEGEEEVVVDKAKAADYDDSVPVNEDAADEFNEPAADVKKRKQASPVEEEEQVQATQAVTNDAEEEVEVEKPKASKKLKVAAKKKVQRQIAAEEEDEMPEYPDEE